VGADQTFRNAASPADTIALRITRVVSAENATRMAPSTNVTAFSFSEVMKTGTLNASTVKLHEGRSTTALSATVAYEATAKKATLNPSANLQPGAKYRAVVSMGATDTAGTALDQSPTTAGTQQKS
jgi:Big-like domain-containing protein